MSSTKDPILAELANYEAALTGIESRFKETQNAIWIGEGDSEKLLQCVQELIDLLDSTLGAPNRYSKQISAYYAEGLHNMYRSPSLKSVRNIIASLKACQTSIARPVTVLESESEDGQATEYDVMEVCLNGHKITGCLKRNPNSHENFCKTCGAETTSVCRSCETTIRGDCHVRRSRENRVLGGTNLPPVPNYCINCGGAYPWQAAAIENFMDIMRGELSPQDVEELDKAIPDIVHETPKTESASLRVKRILGKLGKPLYEVAIKVAADLASETAKKTMGLS